jgi:hypothetical protein
MVVGVVAASPRIIADPFRHSITIAGSSGARWVAELTIGHPASLTWVSVSTVTVAHSGRPPQTGGGDLLTLHVPGASTLRAP